MKGLDEVREMKVIKFTVTLLITTILFLLFFPKKSINPSFPQPPQRDSSSSSMSRARSFVLWLHGLGDSGPANEPIKTLFTSPEFRDTKWSFPSAPSAPVTCNYGSVMPSWFDILEIPVTAESPNDESSLLKAVQNVHATIDREIAAGVNPKNVFICGFSQGGALTLASALLYPKTLGGGAIFSGWVPFNSSITEQITPEAKQEFSESNSLNPEVPFHKHGCQLCWFFSSGLDVVDIQFSLEIVTMTLHSL
ncbi:probable carboxylesterase SOBER1-like isoform X2 [Vigna umbellata]|uniref:probable carboxylesterase SOBER1-like isoform X2 n=1 Tax=Vigna umbellata TaxID=87088 RepID=UPI001F5F8F2E|nr:probable carboxylesterase SOBER1-like isoform X2 [Vigna umbellata]